MKCPDCGIEIVALPCERCASEAARHKRERQSLVEEFSLIEGPPDTDDARASLDFALIRLRERLAKERWEGTVSFSPNLLLRASNWWYIPYCWIGCSGFIVNLDTGYVNWLGSALSLKHCFWGHEHGIVCDLVDFTFSSDTTTELAARLLPRFKHMHKNGNGVFPEEPVWYRQSELQAALMNQFPKFTRHFIWFAIPELFQACKNEGLRFTCSLSE